MTRNILLPFFVLAFLFGTAGSSCEPAEPGGDATETEAESTPAEQAERILIEDAGFSTPESVLYDAKADVYLVSNINGAPTAVDGNGFISRVKPDGTVDTLKWIDGAADGVTLNAPKGMALMGEVLFVADITHVRMFDRNSGEPKGEVEVKGATFLNDLFATTDAVYVTDSGLTPEFKPSGSDAVYKIDAAGKLTPVAKSKELGAPNGVLVAGDDVWVVTFGSGELYNVGTGKKAGAMKLPQGQLDGIVALPDGHVLVSSWAGQAVYRGKPGEDFTAVIEDVESPADIGWDSKRGRVLVPLFNGNAVLIQAVD